MPIFEFLCKDCGKASEILIFQELKAQQCSFCGSGNIKKILSTPASISGKNRHNLPGPNDTTCCGSSPGEAGGCSGPGSCCGKNFV